MSQSPTFPELVVSEADVNLSIPEQVLNRPLPISAPVGSPRSLDNELAIERQLVQLVLSEAEAAFKSPVRHFFNPGGQQLHYNHD